MDFTALNARLTMTGDRELRSGLATIDQQVEKVDASFRRVSGEASAGLARAGAQAARTAQSVEGIGESAVHMSHSSIIGLGELTRGIGRIGATGEASAFAIRELSGGVMRLGASFGALGSAAGIAVLIGGAIYEAFSKAQRKIEETRIEIGKLANDAKTTELRQKLNEVAFGNPFDDKGKLQKPSQFVPGAFEGSLRDLEAHMDRLNQQIPRGATMASGKIVEEYNRVSKALDEARQKFADLRQAMLNVASQPAGTQGLLPMVTSAQSDKGEESEFSKGLKRMRGELESFNKDMDRLDEERLRKAVSTQLEAIKQGEEETHRLAMKANEERDKSERDLFDFLLKIDKIWEENQRRIQQDLENRAHEMGSAIANAITAGIEGAFSRGGGLKNAFASATKALLSSLGDMAIRLGESSAAFMGFLKGILTAIGLGNPELGLAASIALIAFGSVLKSAGANIGTGGGGGSSYATSYGGAGIGSAIYVNAAPSSNMSAGGIQARPNVTLHATIIGKDDPTAQRQLLEMIARAERRGATSG